MRRMEEVLQWPSEGTESGTSGTRPLDHLTTRLQLLLALVCLLCACRFPTTVYGRLELKPGEEGDMRLARVALHDSAAWDSAPVYVVAPESGAQFFRAAFEFAAVAPGAYYLLAWQDRDADGRLSDGDVTGAYGGPHQPGAPSQLVVVYQGWTVDAGEIEMARYNLLEVLADGARSLAQETTSFTYRFNHDVTLNSLVISFPGQPSMPDPDAPGRKRADSIYKSGGWRMGGVMPAGLHQLEFRGWFGNQRFDLRRAVWVE